MNVGGFWVKKNRNRCVIDVKLASGLHTGTDDVRVEWRKECAGWVG